MRQLYINGNIATVDENMSYVEAFAVENALFIKTGSNEEILDLKDFATDNEALIWEMAREGGPKLANAV